MTRIQLLLLGFLSDLYGASSTIVTCVKTSKSLDNPQGGVIAGFWVWDSGMGEGSQYQTTWMPNQIPLQNGDWAVIVFMDEQSRRSDFVGMKVMNKKTGYNMFVNALNTHFTITKIQRVKDLAGPAICGQCIQNFL
ncbi:hypothetical protein BG004_005700 [Podila humilis]|nr:hypothetical protein BG004_005700 [Podila humilis]